MNRHVPEIVHFSMFATIVLTTATLEYASEIAEHRVAFAAFVLVMLIALVVFLIVDLNRPRHGLIHLSQESLLNLQQTIGSVPGPIANTVELNGEDALVNQLAKAVRPTSIWPTFVISLSSCCSCRNVSRTT